MDYLIRFVSGDEVKVDGTDYTDIVTNYADMNCLYHLTSGQKQWINLSTVESIQYVGE